MQSEAVVLEEPGELDVRTIGLPDPTETDVVLDVELSGVCGTDVHMYNGGMDLEFPVVPGHEFAGVIDQLGVQVEEDATGAELHEGDKITAVPSLGSETADWYSRNMPTRSTLVQNRDILGFSSLHQPPNAGGMSEYMVLPERATIYKLPDAMDVELGALVEPIAVASHALERAYPPGLPHAREGFGIGKSVAVQGAGPIGLLTLMTAAAAGAKEIIAIDMLDERLELATEFGATTVINMSEYEGEEAYFDAVRENTPGGVGPDVVVEAAGVPDALRQAIEIVHAGGTVVEAGHYAYNGEVEINPTTIVQKELDLCGSLAYSPTQFETAIALLEQCEDEVPFKELFNHRVGFDAVEEAYRKQEEGDTYRATIHP